MRAPASSFVRRTRDSRCSLGFGRQWSRRTDHARSLFGYGMAGGVIGLVCGAGYLLYALGLGSGVWAAAELGVHATVAGVLICVGASSGLLLGYFRRRRKPDRE